MAPSQTMPTADYHIPSQSPVSPIVIDIGGSHLRESFQKMLQARMLTANKQCVLPSALLSDEAGSLLWQKINRHPTYYQTEEEIDLLALHGSTIAESISIGCVLIDLGCGDFRKIRPLLDKLEFAKKPVQYYGLDLSREIIEQGLAKLSSRYKFVDCRGLWGTFDDALRWSETVETPKWFLSLGSILGNDFFEPATAFLSKWVAVMKPDDRMLLAMDGTTEKFKVWNSYNNSEGLFQQFMRGGLAHSNRVLGYNWYVADDWEVISVMTENPLMHRFVFKAVKDVLCQPLDLYFPAGHEIDCYEAFKYGPDYMRLQFLSAGLKEESSWNALGSSIYEYLLSRA